MKAKKRKKPRDAAMMSLLRLIRKLIDAQHINTGKLNKLLEAQRDSR